MDIKSNKWRKQREHNGGPRFLHLLLKSCFRRSSSFVRLKVEIKDGDDQAFSFPGQYCF